MLLTISIAAGLAAACLSGACAAAITQRFTRGRRQAPPASTTELDRSRVRFPARDGLPCVEAWYFAAKPSRAAVIFVCGKRAWRGGEPKPSALALAQRLVEAGLSVLMVDLRDRGSRDTVRRRCGTGERFDVLGAVDWLLERGYDVGRIGAHGATMDASIPTRVACRDEAAIGAWLWTADSDCRLDPQRSAPDAHAQHVTLYFARHLLAAGRAPLRPASLPDRELPPTQPMVMQVET